MKIMGLALSAVAIGLVTTGVAIAQPAPPAGAGAAPIPQQNCLLKQLTSCKADGSCAPQDNLKGAKLPVKMTVDLDAGIVAGVGPDGWVDATRIASVARSGDELILQGIDTAVAWQLLIRDKGEAMSFSLATADGASVGFGDCAVPKEQ